MNLKSAAGHAINGDSEFKVSMAMAFSEIDTESTEELNIFLSKSYIQLLVDWKESKLKLARAKEIMKDFVQGKPEEQVEDVKMRMSAIYYNDQ